MFLLKLFAILVFAMITNTIIGTSYANIKNTFNKELALKGLWRLGSIALAFGLIVVAAYVDPTFSIDGVEISNVAPVMLKAGILLYLGKVIVLASSLIGIKVASILPTKSTVNTEEKVE